MRLLFVNSLYTPNVRGGAERSIQSLAEAFTARGHQATVASTVARDAGGERIVNGVKAVYLPIANLHWPFDRLLRPPARRKLWHLADAYNPGMKVEIGRVIRDERPDLVHTSNLQGISVAAWHAARAAGVPILHTLQDYYLTCGRCSRYRAGRTCESTCWDCLPLMVARRRASGAVSGVVGVSRYILDHHLRLGLFTNARFSSVIPHESPPVVGRESGSDAEAPLTFGYLGRLVPEKGLERLIDAFTARKSHGSRLLIAGVGEEGYSRELSRRAANHGQDNIDFSGWIDPPKFFRRVDALVLPSLWQEPLARVTLEAFAHGVPVVGSRRGGIPEAVKDGLNGLLFDPEEAGALVGAIDRVARDRALLRRLSENALQSARENSLDHIVNAYDDAYRQVLAPAPRSARGQ